MPPVPPNPDPMLEIGKIRKSFPINPAAPCSSGFTVDRPVGMLIPPVSTSMSAPTFNVARSCVSVSPEIVLSVGLSLGIAPSVIDAGVPTGSVQLMLVALTQVVVGALLGFVAQLLLGVIAAAGSLVDVFGGFALAAAYDPLAQSVNTIFGRFHQMLATMLLFAGKNGEVLSRRSRHTGRLDVNKRRFGLNALYRVRCFYYA